MAYSQEAVLTAKSFKRTYRGSNNVDSNNVTTKYDKTICKDTLIIDELFNTFSTSQSKTVITTQKKYDSQARLIEQIKTRIDSSKGNAVKDTFVLTSATKKREKYIYTAANVKVDTLVQDELNVKTNTWSVPFKSVMRKAGFGYDTVSTASYYAVWDNKARLIISKNISFDKFPSDSTRYIYGDDDKIQSYEYFIRDYNAAKPKLARINYAKYFYENGQTSKLVSIGGYYNTDSTIITTNIYYKNNVLDYEETSRIDKRRYATSPTTFAYSTDSSRFRVRYLYNTAGKVYEKIREDKSMTTGNWGYTGGTNMVYQNDTLLIRDTTITGVFGDVKTVTYYEYGTCKDVISNNNDIAQPIDFTVAPNPAHGQISIQLGDDYAQEVAQVTLLNVQGSVVTILKSVYNAAVLDVSQLPRGMYFIKITQQNKSTTKKVVLN
jgi:hypothetical protein